jgi:hypothetical protein
MNPFPRDQNQTVTHEDQSNFASIRLVPPAQHDGKFAQSVPKTYEVKGVVVNEASD